MKRKYLAITLSLGLSAALLSGCGKSGQTGINQTETNQTTSSDEAAERADASELENKDAIYGEVRKVEETSIAINVGTMREMSREESGEEAGGQKPSMLDLTGEEQEIAITEDTMITRQGMGQPKDGGAPGEADSDGDAKKNEGGEAPGDGGGMPAMENEEIAMKDISEGDTVAVTLKEDGSAAEITVMSMGGGVGGMGQNSVPESYESVKEYSEDTDVDGETVTSTGTDENAIHVTKGASDKLSNMVVDRTSNDSSGGDASSFYGVGAAVLATDGTAYLSGSSIDTDASGGAGIFAYGDGVIYTADTKVSTQQDASGGIHAAGGGSLYAWDMDVETNGESAAAIRSDRGGGTMVVDGGTYTSNGLGSPAIYSTADIAVNNASLTANGSEAVCIEGLNSLRLYDCDLVGNMDDDAQNDCTWNVILYQSMSGDSEVGNSTFEMNGGTLTAQNGGMFYTTNTESTFTLSDVDITYAQDNDFFLRCTGNANQRGWGTTGENGADCLFTATSQEMAGDIIWDSSSQLDFYMAEGSELIGAVVDDETYAGDDGDGYCNLYIGEGCAWTVTGDSTLSTLASSGTIMDESGNPVTIKGTDGTVYAEGAGNTVVTVEAFLEGADLSGMSQSTQWAEYQTDRPSQLA